MRVKYKVKCFQVHIRKKLATKIVTIYQNLHLFHITSLYVATSFTYQTKQRYCMCLRQKQKYFSAKRFNIPSGPKSKYYWQLNNILKYNRKQYRDFDAHLFHRRLPYLLLFLYYFIFKYIFFSYYKKKGFLLL